MLSKSKLAMASAPAASRWLLEMFWKERREDKKDESKECISFIVFLMPKVSRCKMSNKRNVSQTVIKV